MQGQEFDSAVVALALGVDQFYVEEQFEKLDRFYGFIRRVHSSGPAGRHPTERYQFVHILYLNTLTESLSASRLVSLSGAIAKGLLEVHGDRPAPLASRLASLFEAARDFASAAKYFLAAAQQATEVCADREAVSLARRGLSLLEKCPVLAERNRLEILLQLALATAFTRMRGYGDAEAKVSFERSYTLCGNSDDSSVISRTLAGLAAHAVEPSDLRAAVDIAEGAMQRDESPQNKIHLVWFAFIASAASSFMGEPVAALKHAERGLQAYNPEDRDALISFGG